MKNERGVELENIAEMGARRKFFFEWVVPRTNEGDFVYDEHLAVHRCR
jgi:hypothetical protein